MNIQYNRFCNIASTNYSQYICFSIRDSILDNLLITSTLKSFEFFKKYKLLHFDLYDCRFSKMGLEYGTKLFMA